MPARPWKRLVEVDPEREYLAIVTYLPLERYTEIREFLRATKQVVRQLEESAGAVAYSLDAHLPRKRFWTLSVWETSAALSSFARAEPHRALTREYGARMPGFATARWEVSGTAVPPSWTEARTRLQAASNGRSAG